MQIQEPEKSPFILVREAVKLTNCPRSTILKYSALGLFPTTVRLLGDRIAFVRADVLSWIDSRLAQANSEVSHG